MRVMDGRFMAIQQAMGMPKGRPRAHDYLKGFVEEMKASGFCRRCAEAQQPARRRGRAEGVTRRTSSRYLSFVMPGLEPGIHLFLPKWLWLRRSVDGRVKPGHDEL